MKLTMRWTQPVLGMSRSQLWARLADKATNPEPYVAAITSSTVLRRDEDAILRQVQRGERCLRQWISFDEQAGIISFTNDDESDIALIRNILSEQRNSLTLDLELTLTEQASERAVHDQAYLRGIVDDFGVTAAGMTQALQGAR